VGSTRSSRAYADFSRTPSGFARPTPDIGQHSAEILRDWGVPESRIATLLSTGAVFAGDGLGGIAKAPQGASVA
jgi:crotonobetainyl-CoA:carnitine CoA-transferase CaiB-like acyl-CoA transferase